MPLETQLVDLPIGVGIDEKTGKPSAQKLLACTNGRIRKIGSLERRPGHAILSRTIAETGSNLAASRRLMSLENELCLDNGRSLYCYSSVLSKWATKSLMPEACITKVTKGEHGKICNSSPVDYCYCAGYHVCAWVGIDVGATTHEKIFVRVIDATTGTRFALMSITCHDLSHIRLVVQGTKVILFYVEAVTHNIVGRILDTSAITSGWSAAVAVAADNGVMFFDAVCTSSTRIYLAYRAILGGMGGAQMTVLRLDTALAVTATLTYAGIAQTHISICGATNKWLYVAIDDASPNGLEVQRIQEAAFIDDGTTVVDAAIYNAGASQICNIGICLLSDDCVVAYSTFANILGGTSATLNWAKVSTVGAVTSLKHYHHVQMMSRPVADDAGNGVYLVAGAANTITLGPTLASYAFPDQSLGYYLYLSTEASVGPRVVSRMGWFTAGNPTSQTFACGLWAESVGHYVTALLSRSADLDSAISLFYYPTDGFDLYHLNHKPLEHSVPLPTNVNRTLVMSGGNVPVYDNNQACEYGFHYAPSIVTSQTADAGGLVGPGTWGFAVTYEWPDSRGMIHSSAPAFYSEAIPAMATNKVTILASVLSLSDRFDINHTEKYPIRIVYWATQKNGSIYYRIGEDECVAYDNYATMDFLAATEPTGVERILYTDGGVLENYAPPAFRHVCYHANRVVGISADDPEQIWLSKINDFSSLPGFHGDLVIRDTGSPCTALMSLEGKLVVFHEKSIHVIYGTGPSNIGQGNDLTDPQEVSTEVGCPDPRSLVLTSTGACFRAKVGFYSIDKGLGIKQIGLPIEDTAAAYPVTTGVMHDESTQEIRWTCTTSDGATGVVLVWNYLLDQWHVWRIKSPGGTANYNAVSCCMHWLSGVYTPHYLWPSGKTSYESGWLDLDGTAPDLYFLTPHLHLAGMQGYERVRRVTLLGEFLTTSSVTMVGYNNYVGTGTAAWTKSWTSAEVTALKVGERAQVQVHVPTQKCQALQLAVTLSSNTDAGLRIHGLTLQVGVKRGSYRGAAAERK